MSKDLWTPGAAARLRIAARENRVTQPKVAEDTGISLITVKRIMGGSAVPDDDQIPGLAAAVGLSVGELLEGQGGAADLVSVPIYNVEVAAGHGREPFEEGPIGEWPFPATWLRENFGDGGDYRLVRVSGDSQEPELHDRDFVLINMAENKLKAGMHVVALDGYLLLKRIQLEGRTVRLTSRNEAYPPVPIDITTEQDRLRVIAKAVWAGKFL